MNNQSTCFQVTAQNLPASHFFHNELLSAGIQGAANVTYGNIIDTNIVSNNLAQLNIHTESI